MRLAVQRAKRRASVAVGAAAEYAGKTVRGLRSNGAGLLGAASIAYGAGLIYQPLLFIVAGVFLLILDRDV